MLETFADERDKYEQADNRLAFAPLLATLSERERLIVIAIAVRGQTRETVSRVLKITPQRVGKIYRKALEKMKKSLLKDEK